MGKFKINKTFTILIQIILTLTSVQTLFHQFLKLVSAKDCFRDRFPFIIGYDTGETKITHLGYQEIDILYFAGTTKATELLAQGSSQTVFFAKFDCSKLLWFKTIDHMQVDNIEQMLLMGDSSSILAIIASSSSDKSLILYKILKFDGSLISGSSIVVSCFTNSINVTL